MAIHVSVAAQPGAGADGPRRLASVSFRAARRTALR